MAKNISYSIALNLIFVVLLFINTNIKCQTITDTTRLSNKVISYGKSLTPLHLDSTTTKNKLQDSLSLKTNILPKNKLLEKDSIDIKATLKKEIPFINKKVIPKKDTILSKVHVEKNKLKNKLKHELTVKKKDFTIHGTLSNQFDYGIVPYYISNASSPMSIFKSQGDMNLSLKKLPLIFNYFYSNPASLMGIQNYYTLKFDYETYEKNIENECVAKKSSYIEKLKETEKLKQELSQKLAFCEAMQSYTNTSNQLNNFKVDSGISKNNISSIPIDYKGIDSSKYSTMDSSKINTVKGKGLSKTDSLKQLESRYTDSLINNFSADSNYQKIKTYKSKIELYEKQIQEYKQAVNLLDSKNIESIDNPYLSKGKNILSKIKKFEIGLCYPNYSTFLINNLTLKGINVGYEAKTYFINASYGKTVNNLQNQQNINNNITSAFQNYSNFFDFSKNQDARKILAGKVGIGNLSQSYIAVGALYGVGKQTYFQSSSNDEKNTVYEVDGKFIYKGYTLYGSFAKSALNTSNEDQTIFTSNRNNAIQIRFSGQLPIIKTKFSLGYRLVDPFFKSFGVGFIRTDNIRYEAKLEQVITSKIKVGVNYRHDEDNILKRYGYKSNLNFLSLNARLKLLKKRVDVNFIYTPIIQNIENISTHFMTKNKSDMKNVVLSYFPKFKKVTTTFTAIYNQYTLYDTIANRNMENINLNVLSMFKNSFKMGFNSSYFNANVRDSISSPRTILSSFETGYTFKKIIYTSFTMKYSYNLTNKSNQYGAAAHVSFPLRNYVFIELHGEKIIVGDFYNSLNLNNLNNFPYYCYVKLNLKF